MSKYTQFPTYLILSQLYSTHQIPTNTHHPNFPVAHNSLYTSHFLILRAPHLQHGHSTSSSHTHIVTRHHPQPIHNQRLKCVLVEGLQNKKNQATRGPPEEKSYHCRLLYACPSKVPDRNTVLVAISCRWGVVCKLKLECTAYIYFLAEVKLCHLCCF